MTKVVHLTSFVSNDLFISPPNSGFLPEAGCGEPKFLGVTLEDGAQGIWQQIAQATFKAQPVS
jgi:hypothetical protein